MLNIDQLDYRYRLERDVDYGASVLVGYPPVQTAANVGAIELEQQSWPQRASKTEEALKRAFDICFALCFLVVALPFLIILAIALRMDTHGSLFFVQQRVGRDGCYFDCFKFRTMRVDAEALLANILASCPEARREWDADHKLKNDPRVSRLGRIARKLSLDELPQLVNILRGQMSVVGPRPIVAAEISKYGTYFADYCAVKPGLTGLWQVSGRNDVSYAKRVQLDCEYRRRRSFLFDMSIVAKTVPAVLFAKGSY